MSENGRTTVGAATENGPRCSLRSGTTPLPRPPSPGDCRCSPSSSPRGTAPSSPARRCSSPSSWACRWARSASGSPIAAIASFIVAVPMGKLVDHYGPKRMWSLSAVIQGALFLAWPFIDSFPEYVALAVAMEVVGTLSGTAHGAYVIDVLPPSERVESRAYMYSALNVGFSVGAFLGGGAIAFGTDVLRWAPVLSAVLFLANSAAILRLPDASHDVRSSEPRAKPEGIPAIRNRGWIARHRLHRGDVDQPGAAAHRDPGVAGDRDRRAEGARRHPLRHQHGHVHRAAAARLARHPRRLHGTAGRPPLHALLRADLPDHAGHARDRRAG